MVGVKQAISTAQQIKKLASSASIDALRRGAYSADEPRSITELTGCNCDRAGEEGGEGPLHPLV